MIAKKSIGPIFGVFIAAVYGTLIMVGAHDYLPNMSTWAWLLLSGALCVALYFVGRWIAIRSELNKKLPTSSKELRKRRKQFYDWLDSQGPPQSRP